MKGKAHRHVVAAVVHVNLPDGGAADSDLDQIRNIGNVNAIARRRGAIDMEGDLRNRRLLHDRRLSRAFHRLQRGDDFVSDAARLLEVFAENLDHHCAVSAADEIIDIVDDRLAHADIHSRKLIEALCQLGDELFLRLAIGP